MSCLISASAGASLGFIGFVISFLGGDVTINGHQRTGFLAGVENLILFPLIFALFGLFIGTLALLPLSLLTKYSRWFRLKGLFELPAGNTPAEASAPTPPNEAY